MQVFPLESAQYASGPGEGGLPCKHRVKRVPRRERFRHPYLEQIYIRASQPTRTHRTWPMCNAMLSGERFGSSDFDHVRDGGTCNVSPVARRRAYHAQYEGMAPRHCRPDPSKLLSRFRSFIRERWPLLPSAGWANPFGAWLQEQCPEYCRACTYPPS